ncbi:MAG: hypothetical protein WBV81_17310, partial [Ignavibacteriaceae bacterium]
IKLQPRTRNLFLLLLPMIMQTVLNPVLMKIRISVYEKAQFAKNLLDHSSLTRYFMRIIYFKNL